MSAILVLVFAAARTTRFRVPRLGFLGIVLVYIVLSVLVGYWAGRVARDRGRDFGIFMTVGFVVSLCGLVTGLVVVLIAYLMGPKPGAGVSDAGGVPPAEIPQAPPPPGKPEQVTPPTPPPDSAGEVRQGPDGGYEYTPPPPDD